VLEVSYQGTHDGRITEAHQYFDLLTILGQIGAAPSA
jgi:hypothetical protein